MIVFDFIISNTDRHHQNIELYYKDGSIKLSPLYDNGNSLLYDFTDGELDLILDEDESFYEEYKEIMNVGDTPSKAFANNHLRELRLVDDEVIKAFNLNLKQEELNTLLNKYKGKVYKKSLKVLKNVVLQVFNSKKVFK